MSSTIRSDNLQALLTFPFKDEFWGKKFAFGGLFYFLGILFFPWVALSGYSYEIMRRIIVEGAEPSLPEWDDFGQYLQDGFKIFGVNLIYGSPAAMFALPYLLLVVLIPIMSVSEEYSAAFFTVMPLTLVLLIFASLLGFVFGIFGLAAKAHMVAEGKFSAAFHVRAWWPIFRGNIGGFLLGYLLILALGWVVHLGVQLLMLTVILCVVLPFLLLGLHFYISVISSALFAQAYVDGRAALNKNTPADDDEVLSLA